MGLEKSDCKFYAYIDGQPVEIGPPLPKIIPKYSTERLAETWRALSETTKAVLQELTQFFSNAEFSLAMHMARTYRPELVFRYRTTKKKRTRKKYKKRILAWFRA